MMQVEKSALVSRILTFSCVDGPGNRLVLFLQGCNFTCLTCHNPQTINHCNHCGDCISGCPAEALTMNNSGSVVWEPELCTHCDQCIAVCTHSSSPKVVRMSVSQVMDVVEKHAPFLSGVTISGGEATLQLPFIVALFERIKQHEKLHHLTCFIDSNGYLPLQGWQKVAPYLDGVMVDLKSWQQETHQWLVGRDNHRVIQSIRWLSEHNKLHELRLLHIPTKSDLDSEVDSLAQLIQSLDELVPIRLNAFQHHGVVGEALTWPKCSKEQIQQFAKLLTMRLDNPITLPSVYT